MMSPEDLAFQTVISFMADHLLEQMERQPDATDAYKFGYHDGCTELRDFIVHAFVDYGIDRKADEAQRLASEWRPK